jgi:TPR repeat protein
MIEIYKKFFLMLGVTVLICLSASVVWSNDYIKGLDAYESNDFATALRKWQPLAKQGDVLAQTALGKLYEEGKGVTKDYKTALKWYTLAAEQGDMLAQYNVGIFYDLGKGIIQDYKTAVKWYALAAEQGYASAQFNLGIFYFYGRGVIQDNVYAHMWLNISSSLGYEKSPKARKYVERKMTSSDISHAQTLARECVKKKYKGC